MEHALFTNFQFNPLANLKRNKIIKSLISFRFLKYDQSK